MSLRETLDKTMTEREFQEGIVAHAVLHGWRAFHPYDSRRSEPGFPDLILVRGGECLAWELKSEKGRMRPRQQDWLDELGQVPGIEAAVIRPTTYDAALRRLARARRSA